MSKTEKHIIHCFYGLEKQHLHYSDSNVHKSIVLHIDFVDSRPEL